jgi:signal peptidase II
MKAVPSLQQRILPVGLTLGLCIFLDQLSKQLAAHYLSPLVGTAYMGGLLRLIYAQNSGMFSSLGAGLSATARFWLFTVAVSVLLCGLLVYLLLGARVDRSSLLGGAMIVGGGLSNVLDRLLHQGMAIDFIYLVIDGWITDVFNLADLAISVGLIVLLWNGLRRATGG